MTRLSPEALQNARRDAAARFLEIAARHTPPGLRVEYRRRLTGCAWVRGRRIAAPRPVTRRALHVYLHEVAHVVLHHIHEKPVHLQEYEAEQWAFEVMRAEGVAIPKSSLIRAQTYVAFKIRQEIDAGGLPIHLEAARFAQVEL